MLRRALAVFLLTLASLLVPRAAQAFCGFFVAGAGATLVNDATQVALMRSGVRTVLSMRNSYRGPPEGFALVIPVPVVLQREQVRTLDASLFEQLDVQSAPRLVEYWEQDPCPGPGDESDHDRKEGGTGTKAKGGEGSAGRGRPLVRVEAEFSVDEYDIVILSADDSTALEGWLKRNGYNIPPRVEPHLRPYVQGGSKFFVAKVDPAKVRFVWGRAVLSPLRFHYDSERLELPIRLGLANADGKQDLLVYVLSPGTRYEVANYDNVFIPTNLEVRDQTRLVYPSFYASLFERAIAGKPRAVVTEYSWDAASCDPCPTPPLDAAQLGELGADVLPQRGGSFVLTRLHARYGADTAGDDLVFRAAPPIAGGNEGTAGVQPSSSNSFQGRYVIRHPWRGAVTCDEPRFGQWGGPPEDVEPPAPPSQLSTTVRRDLPIDELLLARAESAAAGRSPAHGVQPDAHEREAPSWWRRHHADVMSSIGKLTQPSAVIAVVAQVIFLVTRRQQGPRGGQVALSLLFAALPFAVLQWRQVWSVARWSVAPTLIFVAYQIATPLVVHWGGRFLGGSRGPLWAPLAAALAPLSVALFCLEDGLASTLEAAASVKSVGAAARVLAQGEGESLVSLVLGALASALLLGLLVIEGARARESGATVSPSGASIGVGALSLGATLLAFQPMMAPAGQVARHLSVLLPLGSMAAAAMLERARGDAEGRGRARAEGAWLLLLSGLLLTVAAVAGARAVGLEAFGGERASAGEVASFVALRDDSTRMLVLGCVAAVLSAAPMLLGAHVGLPRQAIVVAPLAALALLLGGALAFRERVAAAHRSASLDADARLASTPSLRRDAAHEEVLASRFVGRALTGPLLQVRAPGELWGSLSSRRAPARFDATMLAWMGQPSEDLDARTEPLLQADVGLSVADLGDALTPLRAQGMPTVRWVLGDRPAAVATQQLGRYADVLSDQLQLATVDVELRDLVEVRALDARQRETSWGQSEVLAVRVEGQSYEVAVLAGGGGRYGVKGPSSRVRALLEDGRPTLPSGVMSGAGLLCVDGGATISQVEMVLGAMVRSFAHQRWGRAPRRARVVLTTGACSLAPPG